jgi:hypothetical protein
MEWHRAMLRTLVILAIALQRGNAGQAQDTHDEIYLRATVQAVVPLADFSGSITPVDRDPRFALTVRIDSVVPVVVKFSEGAVVTFAIHSPWLLFAGEPTKGETYDFSLGRKNENGKTSFAGLTVERRKSCKFNPHLVGECYRVHGRAFATNGTPNLRIWQIGTDRILGVTGSGTADDAKDAIAPDNLFRALDGDEHFVFGNFEVCPFTQEREGHMRMVCVERADKLVIEPYSYGSRK